MARPPNSQEASDSAASGKYIQEGRLYESAHRLEEAVDSYIRGGAFNEAARVLSHLGRFQEAGETHLYSLPEEPTPVHQLTPDARRHALNAALCFARGGARREAVGLLMNLGEHHKAASLLSRAGLRQEAVLAMRGSPLEGSPWPPGVVFPLRPAPALGEGRHSTRSAASAYSFASDQASSSYRVPHRSAPRETSSRSTVRAKGAGSRTTSGPDLSASGAPDLSASGAPDLSASGAPDFSASGAPDLSLSSGSDFHSLSGSDFQTLSGPDVHSMEGPNGPFSMGQDLSASSARDLLSSGAYDLSLPSAHDLSSSGAHDLSVSGVHELSSSGAPDLQMFGGTDLRPLNHGDLRPPKEKHAVRVNRSQALDLSKSHARATDARRSTGSGHGPDTSQTLVDIMPGDPRLPSAVQTVLRSRWRQDPLSPRTLQFLDRYVEAGASGKLVEGERPTFYAIGRLYEYHDRMGAARKAYRVAHGGHGIADAATRLEKIDEGLVQTTEGRWLPLHIVVDGKKHRFAELPDLDRLPALTAVVLAPDETIDFDDYMAGPLGGGASSSWTGAPSPAGGGAGLWNAESVSRSADIPSTHHGPITEGSIVADRYRIDSFVGQGGMGTVYQATDMELEEVVAIKVFQQVVQNTKGLERFRREMKLSRKLIHPNVVRIYEFGTWRGARYITMELLKGLDLEEYAAERGGTLPTSQALSLMMQCCDGLVAAHKQGIVHRDIKPQNLFVVDGGKRLKIMDFGIAKVSNSTSISITGVRVGTPRYMAPEQIQGGGHVGPAADLYALGGVMYELFTGSPVFEEEELVPLLLNHMTEEPIPPSERNPSVPSDIEHIILRLLQKTPEDRYRDAADLKRQLLSAYVQAERLPRQS